MLFAGEKKIGQIYLGNRKIVKVYYGEKLVWQLMEQGLVLCAWGNPGNGRLGNGVTTGTFYSPVQIGSDSDWEMVSAGSAHSLGMKKSQI